MKEFICWWLPMLAVTVTLFLLGWLLWLPPLLIAAMLTGALIPFSPIRWRKE